MSGSVSPSNAFQRRNKESNLETHKPSQFEQESASCIILQVYDIDDMIENGVPAQRAGRIARSISTVFARVRLLSNGQEIIVPFQYPVELLSTIYGNSVLIAGRRGTIIYRDSNVNNGQLILGSSAKTPPSTYESGSRTADIGGMY